MGNAYRGSKATAGLCQPLIAMMPPHSVYIETHLGGGAIMRRKPAALRNIGIDIDGRALSGFTCDYPVERVHGCCHRFPADFPFDGTELVYGDPPYLQRTRKSRHRYRHGHAWARHPGNLLLTTCRRVREQQNKALSEPGYKAVRTRYRTIPTQAKRELPKPPTRLTGPRGRLAKSDADKSSGQTICTAAAARRVAPREGRNENLHEALTNYETEALRFARDPDVPFTNHRAERDIRMAKVKQKVSGCFGAPAYADAYCRISGYLQSMTLQGYNPLTAIEIALKGDAAGMVEKPLKNKPARQDQDKGGE